VLASIFPRLGKILNTMALDVLDGQIQTIRSVQSARLRPAVGTGRVDVPDPGGVGSVQHREGPGPHTGHAAVGQVPLTAAGDVRRAAQSGQPQPDPGDYRSPGPE
jgi:hypothetical protein